MGTEESVVATARSPGYDAPDVRKALRKCLEALPDMQRRFMQADSVLLKPNLLSSTATPDKHINTHPAVVQALAEILVSDFHCRVAVGDSCGTLTRGSTAKALANSGMGSAAKAAGAEIYNVDAQPRHTVSFPEARVFREIPLPTNLPQFDVIVPVAKLKTHSLTYMTCTVKNLLGLVPGSGKKDAHLLAPRADEFAALLCDLFALIHPPAGFVDGVVGMEGNGPNNGRPRHVGLIGASEDCVALDSVCAQVMGLDPLSVPLLAECDRRGLGSARLDNIRLVGEPAAAFAPSDFALPPAYFNSIALRALPKWLFRGLFDTLCAFHASIDRRRCTRCGECLRNCPSRAISYYERRKYYRVEKALCIRCHCCNEVCPSDAIRMRRSLPGRALECLNPDYSPTA